MTYKLKNKSIKSFKLQHAKQTITKKLNPIMDIYFTSKIRPAFFKTLIN